MTLDNGSDLSLALLDSQAVAECAKAVGLTDAQARAFLAELGELPLEQMQRVVYRALEQRAAGDARDIERMKRAR